MNGKDKKKRRKFSNKSNFFQIRIEASKILGDLGPVDLNTMILSSDLYKKDLPKAVRNIFSIIKSTERRYSVS